MGSSHFQLASRAFDDGGWIPPLHTLEGLNLSPPLHWLGEPGGTASFSLVVDDPDLPDFWTPGLLPASASRRVRTELREAVCGSLVELYLPG